MRVLTVATLGLSLAAAVSSGGARADASSLSFSRAIGFYRVFFAAETTLPLPGGLADRFPGYSSMRCAFLAKRTKVLCNGVVAGPATYVVFAAQRISTTRARVKWVFSNVTFTQPVGSVHSFVVNLT